MDQLFQALHKNGQVWYFRSKEEMKNLIRPADCLEWQELPVTRVVIALVDLHSEDNLYEIKRGEVIPVIEEFNSHGEDYVLLPIRGYSVSWKKSSFNEHYVQTNSGGVN